MPSSELGRTVRSSSGPDIQKGKGTKRRLTDKPGVWSDDFESSGLYQILRPILRRHGYHYEDGETEGGASIETVLSSLSILPMHDSICLYFRLAVLKFPRWPRMTINSCTSRLHRQSSKITILYHHAELLNFSSYSFN